MKYHAIIVDDVYAAEALKNLLQDLYPEINVCCTSHSISEVTLALKAHQPEMVFLNISFAGIFEFIFSPAYALQNRIIIFTLNAGEGYLTNLWANGLDFLMKPFSAEAVNAALPQAMQHYELIKKDPDAVSIYLQSLQNLRDQVMNHRPTEKITVPVRFGYQVINLSELIYMQADEKFTILYLTDSRVVVSNYATERFLQILPVKYFFQINPFTIINFRFLKMRSGPSGKVLQMADGTLLSVSRGRLGEFDKRVFPDHKL